MHTLLIFMTALFTSLGLVPVLRRWALANGKLDMPDERKIHRQAIPRLGGVAICIAFYFSVLAFVDISREIRGILAGGVLVFVFGLIDDFCGLSPRWKFSGQILGVLVTMIVGRIYLVNMGDLFGTGVIILPLWLAIPFTIFAVVGVVNAINLIDGLDGLSGGVSAIALAAFMLLAYRGGCRDVMFLSAALLGAVVGFLKYNFYPARIFMGDAGSLSVGFVLGCLAVFLTQAPGTGISPAVPVVVLGLPVIDTVWVMVRRMMKGKKPFSPDMTHVHHKFLDLGLQHRSAVIFIYGISLFWALVAIVAFDWPEYWLLPAYLAVSCAFYGGLRFLINHRERFPFMVNDSGIGLRETALYKCWSNRMDYTSPLLMGLFLVYLLMVIIADFSEVEEFLLMVAAGVSGFAVLWFLRRSRRRTVSRYIVKSAFYLIGLVVALLADRAVGISRAIAYTEVIIFAFIAALVLLRSLFRHEGDIAIGVSEVVVLLTGVFALVAFSRVPELNHLASVPIRGGILYLAINTIFYTGRGLFVERTMREKSIKLGTATD